MILHKKSKKNVVAIAITTTVVTEAGNFTLRQIPKLSSVGWWCFLLSDRLELISELIGQLPLVISFKAVFLFVMSGTGLILSNFNTEASDSKLSGRNVPIINTFVMILC